MLKEENINYRDIFNKYYGTRRYIHNRIFNILGRKLSYNLEDIQNVKYTRAVIEYYIILDDKMRNQIIQTIGNKKIKIFFTDALFFEYNGSGSTVDLSIILNFIEKLPKASVYISFNPLISYKIIGKINLIKNKVAFCSVNKNFIRVYNILESIGDKFENILLYNIDDMNTKDVKLFETYHEYLPNIKRLKLVNLPLNDCINPNKIERLKYYSDYDGQKIKLNQYNNLKRVKLFFGKNSKVNTYKIDFPSHELEKVKIECYKTNEYIKDNIIEADFSTDHLRFEGISLLNLSNIYTHKSIKIINCSMSVIGDIMYLNTGIQKLTIQFLNSYYGIYTDSFNKKLYTDILQYSKNISYLNLYVHRPFRKLIYDLTLLDNLRVLITNCKFIKLSEFQKNKINKFILMKTLNYVKKRKNITNRVSISSILFDFTRFTYYPTQYKLFMDFNMYNINYLNVETIINYQENRSIFFEYEFNKIDTLIVTHAKKMRFIINNPLKLLCIENYDKKRENPEDYCKVYIKDTSNLVILNFLGQMYTTKLILENIKLCYMCIPTLVNTNHDNEIIVNYKNLRNLKIINDTGSEIDVNLVGKENKIKNLNLIRVNVNNLLPLFKCSFIALFDTIINPKSKNKFNIQFNHKLIKYITITYLKPIKEDLILDFINKNPEFSGLISIKIYGIPLTLAHTFMNKQFKIISLISLISCELSSINTIKNFFNSVNNDIILCFLDNNNFDNKAMTFLANNLDKFSTRKFITEILYEIDDIDGDRYGRLYRNIINFDIIDSEIYPIKSNVISLCGNKITKPNFQVMKHPSLFLLLSCNPIEDKYLDELLSIDPYFRPKLPKDKLYDDMFYFNYTMANNCDYKNTMLTFLKKEEEESSINYNFILRFEQDTPNINDVNCYTDIIEIANVNFAPKISFTFPNKILQTKDITVNYENYAKIYSFCLGGISYNYSFFEKVSFNDIDRLAEDYYPSYTALHINLYYVIQCAQKYGMYNNRFNVNTSIKIKSKYKDEFEKLFLKPKSYCRIDYSLKNKSYTLGDFKTVAIYSVLDIHDVFDEYIFVLMPYESIERDYPFLKTILLETKILLKCKSSFIIHEEYGNKGWDPYNSKRKVNENDLLDFLIIMMEYDLTLRNKLSSLTTNTEKYKFLYSTRAFNYSKFTIDKESKEKNFLNLKNYVIDIPMSNIKPYIYGFPLDHFCLVHKTYISSLDNIRENGLMSRYDIYKKNLEQHKIKDTFIKGILGTFVNLQNNDMTSETFNSHFKSVYFELITVDMLDETKKNLSKNNCAIVFNVDLLLKYMNKLTLSKFMPYGHTIIRDEDKKFTPDIETIEFTPISQDPKENLMANINYIFSVLQHDSILFLLNLIKYTPKSLGIYNEIIIEDIIKLDNGFLKEIIFPDDEKK